MRKKDPVDEKTFKMSKVKYPKEKKKKSRFKFVLFLIVVFFIVNGFLAALEYNNIYTIIAETVLKDRIYSSDTATEEDYYQEELPEINQEEIEKILSEYILLNYSKDMQIGSKEIPYSESEIGNIVRLEIASSLIYTKEQQANSYLNFSDVEFTDSKINKAIQEFIGERVAVVVGTTNNKSFTYDSDKKQYMQTGEVTIYPAKVKMIDNIEYHKDGDYILVTFKYCYPTKEKYSSYEMNEKLDEYVCTMKLGLNEDYTYAKYRVLDYKNIQTALLRKNEKVEPVPSTEPAQNVENVTANTTQITPPTNTVDNSTQAENTVSQDTASSTAEIEMKQYLIGVWRPLKGFKTENGQTNDEELSAVLGERPDGNYGEMNLKMDGTFVENISTKGTLTQGTYKVSGNNIRFNYITVNEKKNYKYDPETKTIKMMINETMGLILSK